MFFVNVVIQSFLSRENVIAVAISAAREPVHRLLMLKTGAPRVGRPSLSTPAAFNLIEMGGRVVEVVSDAVVVDEVTATARICHYEGS